MIPLNTVFWGLLLLLGLIGALRGWAKEILVSFSVLLALFVQQIVAQYILKPGNAYVPLLLPVGDIVPQSYTATHFNVCALLLLVLAFFGYASPPLAKRVGAKMTRDKVVEGVLGFFLGVLNGYLIIGTLWFYLARTGYTLWGITPPAQGTAAWNLANVYLLASWISTPVLYVIIAVAFVFVIVVFI